jgi:para-nitrobenzyl esterase
MISTNYITDFGMSRYLFFAARLVKSAVFFGIIAGLTACGDNSNAPPPSPQVSTSLGLIQGVQRYNTVNEYRGIPYAKPLTAQDRWTLAQAALPWEGTLNASQFGAACPQERRFDLTEESLIEDCLTLNVTTPTHIQAGEKLPVLIWIPGGGFVGGSSNLYRLDKLASEGRIIVVSVNYRLGTLGFMAHPAIADGWNGNLGLEDQRLAMQWVKDHIAAFGGDSNKITIAGESAGAASTCLHVLSKTKTAGLFQQAMPLSYDCLYEWPTLSSALQESNITIEGPRTPIYQRMAQELDCFDPANPTSATQLSCMRNKPINELLAAQGRVSLAVPLFPFGPVIGSGANGTVPLANYSKATVEANINRVPMLYGGAKDELRLYVAYDTIANPSVNTSDLPLAFTESQLLKYYALDPNPPTGGWPAIFRELLQTYFALGPVSADGLGSMFSDYTPVVGLSNCSYLRTAKAFSELMPLYQWEFADPNALVLGVGIAKGLDPRMALGPVHSAALNYFFPNLSNTSAIDAPNLPAISQTLANQMVQSWANFVKFATPQTAEVTNWPRFNLATNNENVMQFIPNNIKLINARVRHQCPFWERIDRKLGPLQ